MCVEELIVLYVCDIRHIRAKKNGLTWYQTDIIEGFCEHDNEPSGLVISCLAEGQSLYKDGSVHGVKWLSQFEQMNEEYWVL